MYDIYCKLRDERGVKDATVAKATGVTKSTFTDWKTGRSEPKKDKLEKIASYFNVPMSYIVTGEMPDNIDESAIAHNENEKRLLISFRNAGNLTNEQMDELETLFSQSMDLYLKAKGLKK